MGRSRRQTWISEARMDLLGRVPRRALSTGTGKEIVSLGCLQHGMGNISLDQENLTRIWRSRPDYGDSSLDIEIPAWI